MDSLFEIMTEWPLSVGACILLTLCYVASMYIWTSSLPRDHPTTIKKRCLSAFVMMLLSPFYTQLFLWPSTLEQGDIYMQLGLRTSGLLEAIFMAWILTAILFLGPLTMQYYAGVWRLYKEPWYWASCFSDLKWWRNQVMAPLSEEWVFRACMMPLLLQCMSPITAVFCGPLLFGIAHFHHMLDQIKSGTDFKTAFAISSFQFAYTSLFGAYSAFLFARTGHFAAPLVAHMFCNHMGFPNLSELCEHGSSRRCVIVVGLVAGFALWCYLLVPATDPTIYDNGLHWTAR